MVRATARLAYSSSSLQAVPLSVPGARPPGWPLRLLPLELVGTRLLQKRWLRRSAAPEASTQNDDHYEYIRVPREKMAPVNNGLTETVQHQVSDSAGPQNAAPVLHSVPVQPPAPASQQWRRDSSTMSYTRVSVVQPGGCGDTSVDSVENDPHLEALTKHPTGRLPVPGVSAAAEVKVLMDSG